MFITSKHLEAVDDAHRFIRDASVYHDHMCGSRTTARGFTEAKLENAIELFKEHGATAEDIDFVRAFALIFGHSCCCLPVGHKGPCKHKLDTIFPEIFESKLKDCFITPGNKGMFFNRAARHFPIQLLRTARYTVGPTDDPFAIPIEFGSTGFMTATAYFDWGSLITQVKGFEPTEAIELYLDTYQEHSEFLRDYYLTNYRMQIVNDEGYLCDPFTLETLDLDMWAEGHEIQFAHVLPVSDSAYRTRGLNTVPTTRRTNMLQGEKPWTEFIEELKVHIAKH